MLSLAKISVAVALVWYLFSSGKITTESLEKLLNCANLPFLFLAACAFLVSQMLASVRLVFLLRVTDVSLPFVKAFKLTMIGNFFNMVIPGMVGGDIVKGYMLTKNESDGRGKSSGTIIMDRALGLFALVFIGAIAMTYLLQKSRLTSIPYENELRIVLLLSIAASCLFLLLLLFSRESRLRRKVKALAFKYFRGGFIYNMMEGFAAVTKRRRYLVYSILLSIIVQLLSLAGLFILVFMIGEAISKIIPLLAASSVVMLAGVIPVTPGNIGWTELIASFSWSVFGSGNGAAVFFYWRIITILCSLSGGLFYLYPWKQTVQNLGDGRKL